MSPATLRHLRDGDEPALCALVNRGHRHDGVAAVVDVAELTEEIAAVDAVADIRVAELDGETAGYALVTFEPSGERLERAIVFGAVEPRLRGRGVGRALLSWSVARATELLRRVDNDLPKVIRGDVPEQIADARRLFERAGFDAVRWFEDLLRPLEDVPAVAPLPAYDIVSWPADRAEELRAVRNASFADHWGSTPWSSGRFSEIITAHDTRLDLSVAAVERSSGRVVALCLNGHYASDVEVTGRTDGWISVLATLADHRGNGIATALLAESLRRFAAAGFSHAAIDVDSTNLTGAHRLYRALGFEPFQRRVVYHLEVPAAPREI